MNLKEFEEKVQEIFGIDFTEWYCQVFCPWLKAGGINRIRRVQPRAYRELKQFLEPFIQKMGQNVVVSVEYLENWQPPNKEPLSDQTILLLKELIRKVKRV